MIRFVAHADRKHYSVSDFEQTTAKMRIDITSLKTKVAFACAPILCCGTAEASNKGFPDGAPRRS
jgi:hypothetical protein